MRKAIGFVVSLVLNAIVFALTLSIAIPLYQFIVSQVGKLFRKEVQIND